MGRRARRHRLGCVGEGCGRSERVRHITCPCLHHPRPHPMHLLNLHPPCLNHTTHLFPTMHLFPTTHLFPTMHLFPTTTSWMYSRKLPFSRWITHVAMAWETARTGEA